MGFLGKIFGGEKARTVLGSPVKCKFIDIT